MSPPSVPFKARSTHLWAGEVKGDLGFVEGDVVEVLSIVDDLWWMGRLMRNNLQGIFPADFVKVVDSLGASSRPSSTTPPATTPPATRQPQRLQPQHLQLVHAQAIPNPYSQPLLPVHAQHPHKLTVRTNTTLLMATTDVPDLPITMDGTTMQPLLQRYHYGRLSREEYLQLQNLQLKKQQAALQQQLRIQQQQLEELARVSAAGTAAANATNDSIVVITGEDIGQHAPQLHHAQSFPLALPHNRKQQPHMVKSQLHQALSRKMAAAPRRIKHSASDRGLSRHQAQTQSPLQQQPSQQPVYGVAVDGGFSSYVEEPRKPARQPALPPNTRRRTLPPAKIATNLPSLPHHQLPSPSLPSPTRMRPPHMPAAEANSRASNLSKDTMMEVISDSDTSDLEVAPPPIPQKRSSPMFKSSYNLRALMDGGGEVKPQLAPVPPPKMAPALQQSPEMPFDADDLKLSLLRDKLLGNNTREQQAAEDQLLHALNQQGDLGKELLSGSSELYEVPDPLRDLLHHLRHLQGKLVPGEFNLSTQSKELEILIRSDFSATSAGLYAIHKYQQRVLEQQETMAQLNRLKAAMSSTSSGDTEASKKQREMIDLLFEDKKLRHPKFLKKLFTKEKQPEQKIPDLPVNKRMTALRLTEENFALEMHRMNTLRTGEKQDRLRRANDEENVILKPMDFVSEINQNEVADLQIRVDPLQFWVEPGSRAHAKGRYAYNAFEPALHYLAQYDSSDVTLQQFVRDTNTRLGNDVLGKVKVMVVHLAQTMSVVEEVTAKILLEKPRLLEEMYRLRQGTVFQLNYLLKKVLLLMGVVCEVVLGLFKRPQLMNNTLMINHAWLLVCLNGAHRFVDLMLIKQCDMMNLALLNEFYFMVKPLDLIFTHIPLSVDAQHIVPPVDLLIALLLPYCYLGYFRYELVLVNFNNALTRLRDFEFFEIDIQLPANVEVYAHIKTSDLREFSDLLLLQVLWRSGGRRVVRIKALLPAKRDQGFLQVFAGARGLQKNMHNVLELAVVIPLTHTGEYRAIDFVGRYPTPQCTSSDLYIKHPQILRLLSNKLYLFEVQQSPCGEQAAAVRPCKVALQTPSGKLVLLQREGNSTNGMFKHQMTLAEEGTYRGLVTTDQGDGWCVFATWECIPGSQTSR